MKSTIAIATAFALTVAACGTSTNSNTPATPAPISIMKKGYTPFGDKLDPLTPDQKNDLVTVLKSLGRTPVVSQRVLAAKVQTQVWTVPADDGSDVISKQLFDEMMVGYFDYLPKHIVRP